MGENLHLTDPLLFILRGSPLKSISHQFHTIHLFPHENTQSRLDSPSQTRISHHHYLYNSSLVNRPFPTTLTHHRILKHPNRQKEVRFLKPQKLTLTRKIPAMLNRTQRPSAQQENPAFFATPLNESPGGFGVKSTTAMKIGAGCVTRT